MKQFLHFAVVRLRVACLLTLLLVAAWWSDAAAGRKDQLGRPGQLTLQQNGGKAAPRHQRVAKARVAKPAIPATPATLSGSLHQNAPPHVEVAAPVAVAPAAPPERKLNRADRLAASMRARAARASSPAKARRITRSANLIEFLFGRETLDTSSFEMSVSFILKIPGFAAIGNLSGQVRKWFPSAEYRRDAVERGWREPIWGYSAEVGTLLGSTGYDSVTGFFIPGVSQRGFGTGFGIPNYASVGFGEVDATKPGEYNRGPYIGGSAQVVPLGIAGISLTSYIYYRPAIVFIKRIRPVFDKLRSIATTVGRTLKNAGRWVIGKPPLPRPETQTPPSAGDTVSAIWSPHASQPAFA